MASYVKFQDLSECNRKFLLKYWNTTKNGAFNLYFVFFELGYKLLSNNGTLGYITPNNYFTSLAGEALRSFFHRTKCVNKIVDFNHRKVFDAQTYTAITILNKQTNSGINYDRIEDNQDTKYYVNNIKTSFIDLSDLKEKKWRLLKTKDQKIINKIEKVGHPLKNLVNIYVGIATLKDDLYFLDSKNTRNGYFLKTINNITFEIETDITRLIYRIPDFKTQYDIEHNTRYIIFPYKNVSGNTTPIKENEMANKFPGCFEYLKYVKDLLGKRDKGKKQISPFYAYGRSQGLNKNGIKILTPTFSKFPRFLIGTDEKALFCNGYGVFFKSYNNQILSLFQASIHPLSREENIHSLQKILNSVVMHYYISKTSVAIEGGYPCYQKNFIEKFSIPDFSNEEVEILNSLNDQQDIDYFLLEKYQMRIPAPNLFS